MLQGFQDNTGGHPIFTAIGERLTPTRISFGSCKAMHEQWIWLGYWNTLKWRWMVSTSISSAVPLLFASRSRVNERELLIRVILKIDVRG